MADERDIEDVWYEDMPDRELSQEWTGETFFEPLPPPCKPGYTWVHGRETRKQRTTRPPNVWTEPWERISGKARTQGHQIRIDR